MTREPGASSLVVTSMMRVLAIALPIAACSSPTKTPDAAVVGDGQCGADDFFTGELVDWDSTDSAFCGVFGATFTVDGDASRTNMTNPNGRFQLCLKNATQTVVDITPPAAASQCAPSVGLYQLPALAVARHDVIATGDTYSARMIGMTRAMMFFPPSGLAAGKGLVFVHVDGTPGSVRSSAAHDTPLAFDGTSWAAGDTGVNVVFPNTDVSSGTSMVGFTDGSGVGNATVPVAAGTITYLTLVAH
jgi:hypothetical protein